MKKVEEERVIHSMHEVAEVLLRIAELMPQEGTNNNMGRTEVSLCKRLELWD